MTEHTPTENVILVDINDNEIGRMKKMEAHKKGLLHRAISVFIINSEGKWLIQQRALNKYHSNGLWTNTCCSHPYPSESSKDAANRRLKQEMGMQAPLTEVFNFTYKEKLDNDLTEHELDHVFIGISNDIPMPDPNEVLSFKYIDFNTLKQDIKEHPENYTVWFMKIYERVYKHIKDIS